MRRELDEGEILKLLLSVSEHGKGVDQSSGHFLFIKPDGTAGWAFEVRILDIAIERGLVESERVLRLTDAGRRLLEKKRPET